jgi:hypothetical protein
VFQNLLESSSMARHVRTTALAEPNSMANTHSFQNH